MHCRAQQNDSMEQLFQKLGQVISPDRPTMSALWFPRKSWGMARRLSSAKQISDCVSTVSRPTPQAIQNSFRFWLVCIDLAPVAKFGVFFSDDAFGRGSTERSNPFKQFRVSHPCMDCLTTAHRKAHDCPLRRFLSHVVVLC